MGFSLFGTKTHEEEVSLVLDIGSASVAGALVLFSKNKAPRVLYSVRLPITIPDKLDAHDFTQSMIGFVKKVLEQVSTAGVQQLDFINLHKKDINDVICVYASPWFASETKIIKITETDKKPVVLTEKYVKELIKKETDSFTQSIGIDDDVTIVEQKIISTKLNGYATVEPYNKKARSVEMALFLGIVPKNITEMIEKEVRRVLHPDDIIHHSFSLVAYRTITDIFPANSNSIVFDVTGEVTDISVIENDVITGTASIPFGRNTLVRKIATTNKVTNDIALSLLHLYAKERAETKLYTQIDAIVAGSRVQWKNEITKTVPDLEEKTIFITADPDVAPIFQKYITVSNPRKVVVLNEDHFDGIVETTKGARKDVFISTASVFLNNQYQQKSKV